MLSLVYVADIARTRPDILNAPLSKSPGRRQTMVRSDNRRPATNTLERLHIDQAENRHRAQELGEQLLHVRTSSRCWTLATASCGLP
jgi:hypothetical protein